MAQVITLSRGNAPHLKGQSSFIADGIRAFSAALIFIFAGFWDGGLSAVMMFAAVLISVIFTEIILQCSGFNPAPKWDLGLLHQTALLLLFLPLDMSPAAAAGLAVVLSLIYRVSGGRSGLVLPPVCLTLAASALLGYEPLFLLRNISLIPALVLFAVWTVIRMPRRASEIEKLFSVLVLAAAMIFLHEMPIGAALLWSAAAGEILFDPSLLPLDVKLRRLFRAAALILVLIFTAVCMPQEVLIFCGLTIALAAAVIEERVYGKI